jgi:hypothetical protein
VTGLELILLWGYRNGAWKPPLQLGRMVLRFVIRLFCESVKDLNIWAKQLVGLVKEGLIWLTEPNITIVPFPDVLTDFWYLIL